MMMTVMAMATISSISEKPRLAEAVDRVFMGFIMRAGQRRTARLRENKGVLTLEKAASKPLLK
jgi:hypothetical protein